MSKKLIYSILFTLEAIVLILTGVRGFKSSTILNVPFDSWTTESNIHYSPYFFISKGDYNVSIDYNCDDDATAIVSSDSENAYNLVSNQITLHHENTSETLYFQAKGPTDNVQLSIISDENNTLNLSAVTINRSYSMERRQFVILLFIFLLCDIALLLKNKIINNRSIIFGILAITFLASLPLFSYGTEVGHDLDFHLMRIYGISQELAASHFPVRIQSYFNYGYGYPVSIYYGDILLYFPAILCLLGFQILPAYKIYLFTINLFTTIFCYLAGKKLFNSNRIALLFSAAFTLSTYRFVDLYVRNAVGEYSAMMFIPLVLLGIYYIYYSSDDNTSKNCIRGILALSIGMSGIITAHIMTTEMICVVLLIFAIICYKKTFKKPVLISLLLSVFTTALLSLWFIVPFISYYMNVKVNINETAKEAAKIQENGAFITQYFAPFSSLFGTRGANMSDRLSSTVGMLLMTALCVGIALWVKGYHNSKIRNFTISSLVLLFVSSNIFPWDTISQNKLGNIFAQIQFPYRWLTFASIMLALLLGAILEHLDDKALQHIKGYIYLAFIIILTLQVFSDTSNYADNATNIKNPLYYTDLNGTDYREYFRSGADFSVLSFEVTGDNITDAELVKQNGTDFTFNITSNKAGTVTLPILNYPGYRVWDSDGNTYTIKDGKQKEISIDLPSNFSGQINVAFKESIVWRIAEILSLLTFITVCLMYRRIHIDSKLF